jgi:hypothetical protein
LKLFKNGFLRTLIGMFFILVILFIVSNLPAFIRPSEVLKAAILKNALGGQNYILAQPCSVTGYEWRLAGGTGANNAFNYCIVKGENPESELNLKYEFMTAGNTFVFYVLEQEEYYSDVLGEQCVEYTVEGWDILFPVKHGSVFDGFSFSKHITVADIWE